jgi:hypothetical protein
MSMDMYELEAESAELLPGREALGRLKFSFTKTVTKHVVNVHAHNSSSALNVDSDCATAASDAQQSIVIHQ